MQSKLYPGDSLFFPINIVSGENPVVLSYAAGDIMNNPAPGYGKLWITVFDSQNNIALDSTSVQIKDIYCYCEDPSNGLATAAIRQGLLTAGIYYAQPYYGVELAGGAIDWRKQAQVPITVTALNATTDEPVS